MASIAKKLKNFNQAGMQGVKRASESENKPSHYIPGSYDGYERVVKNRMFNPIHTGDSSWTPTTSSSSSSSANNYNYPSAQTSQPFNSKWSDELNAMYEQIKNKPKFSYDQSKDPLYQQYAAMYQKNAQLAMNDTMARASALTGGYGNSYAQTAGQQMYNQQMDQLNDKALDLYYAALDKYNAENDDLYKQFGLAGQMYGYDYNAWRDQMADSRWAQEFNYGAYRDSISDRRYDDETAYNRGIDARNYNYQLSRDAVSDARYNSEWQHQLEREGIEDKRYDDEQALRYYQARYDPLTGGMSELGQQERAYELLQNQLDRDLQYYQAGYDPKTKGMSAEARAQYKDELALNYAKLGMNPDGTLNAIGRANSYEELYKEQVAAASGKTPNVQEFIKKKGRTGNNTNMNGILSRADFNRTVKEGHEAHVIGKDENGKTKGKGYTNYEDYVTAWLNTQPQMSEAEAIYLFDYYTSQEETKKKSTKK